MTRSGQDDRGRSARSAAADRDIAPQPVVGSTGGWDVEFAAFYREWTKRLVGFLVVQGADVAQAADLVQETMTVLYRKWPQVDHPRPWAFRTASRKLVRAVSTAREIPTDPSPSPLLRAGPSDIERWEQRHDLINQIRQLPPRQRQVMAWTLYGHTPAEISEQLGLSDTAVRANLYHARNALKARLVREEDDR